MALLQAYPSIIPVGISETNPYLIITVLIVVTIVLNIRYLGMIFSFILGVPTLFMGTDFWVRFGLGPIWAQATLILILIILSIKNFALSLFKREGILHPLIREDRYLLISLLEDLKLSNMRRYQALSYWFPIVIFTFFLYIEKPLFELLFVNPQRTGTTVIILLPILGIIFSVIYFVGIMVKEDLIPTITLPVTLPNAEVLDIYFNCVLFYLLLMVIASIIGWKGFLRYATIQLISYSLPVVAIAIWRWEIYEALSILLYYFLGVTISVILLFLLESSKVMAHIRSGAKSTISKIQVYIDKINIEPDKLTEETEERTEEEQFLFLISKRNNWMNWPKIPCKFKKSLLSILTFLPKKIISLGIYINYKCLTFKFREIKQKEDYESFKSKFIDIYLVALKYVIILVFTIPIYMIITYLLYPEISIPRVFVFIQAHPQQTSAIIIFVFVIVGIIYISLLFLYIIFSQWVRKYRTIFVYGEEINWSELTYNCIVEAREFNSKNLIKKAYQYLILALYYNLMEGIELIEVNSLYKIRKGARFYRRKKIEKTLKTFDKISKDGYRNEALKHFGHIYDLVGNYYRKQDNSSMAIEYYLKSKKFNVKVKNWKNVDSLEKKIKELNV